MIDSLFSQKYRRVPEKCQICHRQTAMVDFGFRSLLRCFCLSENRGTTTAFLCSPFFGTKNNHRRSPRPARRPNTQYLYAILVLYEYTGTSTVTVQYDDRTTRTIISAIGCIMIISHIASNSSSTFCILSFLIHPSSIDQLVELDFDNISLRSLQRLYLGNCWFL